MKLSDIINFDLSLWNALGKTGGTALPDNDNSVKVDDVEVWKKHPPFRTGKKKKRVNEHLGGRGGGQQTITPHYDIADEPGIEDIGRPSPGTGEPDEFDNWTQPPKEGKWFMVTGPDGRARKVMIRKTGPHSAEAMDDEGNHFLLPQTGRINFKKMHTGKYGRSQDADVDGKPNISERARTGTGLGGTGATMHPAPGPSELEHDLDKVWDEFEGKNTRADIKTNKKKRETLKQYLVKRAKRETH